jgi:hypothetical protein
MHEFAPSEDPLEVPVPSPAPPMPPPVPPDPEQVPPLEKPPPSTPIPGREPPPRAVVSAASHAGRWFYRFRDLAVPAEFRHPISSPAIWGTMTTGIDRS